jgi:RNA polymerase sigma-70 factor (ECF subfamily)
LTPPASPSTFLGERKEFPLSLYKGELDYATEEGSMDTGSRATERELIAQALAGDTTAANLLVDTHYESVYHWLLHLAGHPEVAADLTQEAFLDLWRGLPGFRGESSLKTWLHRLAYHVFLRHSRSRRDHAPLPEEMPVASPVAALHQQDALMRAVAVLPEEQRLPVLLYYLREMNSGEVARVLGVPEGTVRSRLHYARERLRGLLAEEETDAKEMTEDAAR